MIPAQTHYLGRRAHEKLQAQTSHTDLNLRIIVGHVNLLDSISVLLERERKQQISTVRFLNNNNNNNNNRLEPQRLTTAVHQETVVQVEELPLSDDEDSEDDSEESDSADECDKIELHTARIQSIPAPLRETLAALQRRKEPMHFTFSADNGVSDISDESDEEDLDSDSDEEEETDLDFNLLQLDSSPLARRLFKAIKSRDILDTSPDTWNGMLWNGLQSSTRVH